MYDDHDEPIEEEVKSLKSPQNINNRYEYVEVDDPRRCQAVHGTGQCRYKSIEGSLYCIMHGANSQDAINKNNLKKQYQLAKWQSEVDAFADDDQVKSLRGEIGILRLVLQETLLQCKSSGQLLLFSGKIADMVMKIDKVVGSCHRLESSMGMLLDKNKVLALASVIVEIIGKHVKDDDTIAAISNQICVAILNTQGQDNGKS